MPFTTFPTSFQLFGDTVGWMALTANDNASITELKPKNFRFL
jgi:putative ABC transport system permease protein